MSHESTLQTAMIRFSDPNQRENYFDLYDDRVVLHGYDGVEPGLASVKRFYAAIWEAFPDAQVDLHGAFECGDQIACRFTMRGTHLGAFNGMAPTGKTFSVPGITILRFAGGKCVERWSQVNFLALLRQIGVLSA